MGVFSYYRANRWWCLGFYVDSGVGFGCNWVQFHGQCQQKAFFGTASTHGMLKLIPNCDVEEIESGCCGMAGSFGYEVEHYDLSIELAEMSLAPAVRAASSETIICDMGTSCREQIEHTTGRHALHPIEVVAEALMDTKP